MSTSNTKIQNAVNTTILMLLLCLLYIFLITIFFGAGGKDDSYITYWSAYALSEFGEIVNYNGDRIEQSSSLLYVLILALLHKISGVAIPTLGSIISTFFGLATALLSRKLAISLKIKFYNLVPFVIIVIPAFTYWSTSGMETSLTAFVIVFFLTSVTSYAQRTDTKKNITYVIVSIILYLLVRPESFFVLLAFFLLLVALNSSLLQRILPRDSVLSLSPAIKMLCVTCIVFLLLVTWRYFYFGQIFPQPVYAKTDLGNIAHRLNAGRSYLLDSLSLSMTVLVALSGFSIAKILQDRRDTPADNKALTCFIFLIAYLAYIASSGGDWMEAHRLVVPIIPIVGLLALWAIQRLEIVLIIMSLFFCFAAFDNYQTSRRTSALPPIRALNYFYLAGQLNPTQPTTIEENFGFIESLNYAHLRDILAIPVLDQLVTKLVDKQDQPIYLMSKQMGMIPYYLSVQHYKKIKFIDMRGLVTKDITGCKEIAEGMTRSTSGILLGSKFYLYNADSLDATCGFQRADIIYDISFIDNSIEATKTALDAGGYFGYYFQNSLSGDNFWLFVGVNKKHMGYF